MVRTARSLVLATLAVACLAGCDLGESIFPARLMSYEAYADLSGYLDPDLVWNYSFDIIRDSRGGSGNPEYLVLVSDDRSFDGVHLVVFSSGLKVLGAYTMAELDGMSPASPFAGRGAMVDAEGRVVVGNRRFTVGTTSLSSLDAPPAINDYAVAVPGAANPNVHDIWAGGSNPVIFNYVASATDWLSAASYTSTVGPGTVGKLAGLWLHETESEHVVFTLIYRDTANMQIFALPMLDFANGALVGALETYSPAGAPVNSSSTAWEMLGFTYDGTRASFAVYCWDTNQYVRFGVDGTKLDVSDAIPEDERPYEQRQVYGRTSGWYILDRKMMSLERRAWWWQ